MLIVQQVVLQEISGLLHLSRYLMITLWRSHNCIPGQKGGRGKVVMKLAQFKNNGRSTGLVLLVCLNHTKIGVTSLISFLVCSSNWAEWKSDSQCIPTMPSAIRFLPWWNSYMGGATSQQTYIWWSELKDESGSSLSCRSQQRPAYKSYWVT